MSAGRPERSASVTRRPARLCSANGFATWPSSGMSRRSISRLSSEPAPTTALPPVSGGAPRLVSGETASQAPTRANTATPIPRLARLVLMTTHVITVGLFLEAAQTVVISVETPSMPDRQGQGQEAEHAGIGDGLVTRSDDVPEGGILAPGSGAPPAGGAGTAAAPRTGGDRYSRDHRRKDPADRGRIRGPARAAEGV